MLRLFRCSPFKWFSLFLIVLFVFLLFYPFNFVDAVCEVPDSNDINILQQAKEECQKEIDARMGAHEKNKQTLADLEENLDKTKKLIKKISIQILTLDEKISKQETDLDYQEELLAVRVRSYYKKSRLYSPFLILLASSSANDLFRELSYRKSATDRDKEIIIKISQALKELNEDKEKLKESKKWIAMAEVKLERDTLSLRGEVEEVESYFTQISGKIAELSAKQQALLSEKAGTFQTTVGDVPLADDPASRPDYNPGFSPAFAAFSFGAPHRKGMSQYGALGRAQAGQNAETILKAYYGDVRIEHRGLPETIATTIGTLNFEDNYLRGIAEMPSSWADKGGYEALKAQAIAARSYAIRAGKPICVTESCQVYLSSKVTNPAAAKWHQAVSDTRGIVVVSNQSNDVVSTWYASTAGGYLYSYSSVGHTTPGIWDTACGNQGCWTSEAWGKKADSPWFYKGWYKSRSGATCGRSHPWLNQQEMADILNAVLVYRSGQGTEHILPVDYVSCFGSSGDPWSIDQMKNEANSRGGAFSSINGVSVSYGTDGKTAKINFSTDRGSFEVGGEEFKTVFNLRAPARIALKSKLFNIEQK